MFRNYLGVAVRNLLRNRTTSFINIFGLAVALTCSLLIYLFITDELSYDRYNKNADRIYRVTRDFISPDGSVNLHLGHVAPPFGPLLKNDFPEFKEVGRTLESRLLTSYQDSTGDLQSMYVDHGYIAEPSIFKIFSIEITKGNPLKTFNEPLKIIVSENTAKKLFGDKNPLGKRLKIYNAWDGEVTGVFKDLPDESFWHPEMFISFSTLNDPAIYGKEGLERNWSNNSFGTFILVKDHFNAAKVASRFPEFLDKHMGADRDPNDSKPSTWTHLYLQKVTDIHLHSHLDSEEEANGSITSVYMMGVIGLFILLIACFNFINLSTARATRRSKEVGIRKVSGAYKHQLIVQFISESVVVSLVALAISIGLAEFSIRWMNDFTGKSLAIFNLSHWPLFLGMILFAIITGIVAGLYPAFVISGFKPTIILKGHSGSGTGKGGVRKTLVVTQFALSVMLIVATAITYQQLHFLNTSDLGYDKSQVITLPFYDPLKEKYDAFYNKLKSQSFIKDVARSSRIPTGRLLDSQGNAQVQKGDSMVQSSVTIKNIRCDDDFFNTYSIPLAAGRNFSKDIKSDDSISFILNETAVKMLGVTDDEILDRDFKYGGIQGRVVGVVKDFHFESLKEPIVPVVFKPSKDYNRLSIKITGKDMHQALAYLEKTWKEFIPNYPFEYTFLSERYKNLYESEQKQSELFTIFSGLAILIACLGLFGLAAFNTLQRVKEIGIRKVLGATIPDIISLLSREIMILIVIANIIAWPVAWFAMSRWLTNFAYRININIWLFVLAGVMTCLIALFTIGFQTVKAALANPVDSLRNE